MGWEDPVPQSLDLADDRPPPGILPRMASSLRIILLVIDPLKLAPGSSMDCNRLRRKLHVPENELFETEVLVWQRIPPCAIVAEWSVVRRPGAEPHLRAVRHHTD